MKQPRAGDQLPQHDAEREDVRRARPRLALHLLGRHVRVRAAHRARLADRARDAEIDQHDAIAGGLRLDDQVRRTDVAVHPAVAVEVRGGIARGRHDRQ